MKGCYPSKPKSNVKLARGVNRCVIIRWCRNISIKSLDVYSFSIIANLWEEGGGARYVFFLDQLFK